MSPRNLAGALAGGVIGALVIAGFIGLGLVLNDRVSSDVPVYVMAVAGAYAGWLLGVVVFGAVRGGGPAEAEPGPDPDAPPDQLPPPGTSDGPRPPQQADEPPPAATPDQSPPAGGPDESTVET